MVHRGDRRNPGWLGSKSGGGIAWTQTTYLPLLPPTTHVRLAILSAATVYGVKAYSVELYGQGAFPPPTAAVAATAADGTTVRLLERFYDGSRRRSDSS